MMRFVLVSTLAVTVALGAAAQTTEDTTRNETVARHFFESSNRNDIEGMLSDLAGDAKNFGRPVGREGFRMVLNDIFTTFPDWHVEVVETIAKGDSVVMRCKVSGTHRGVGKIPVNGGMLVGVSPTGKHFETDHIHWLKFRDGKIADHYATRDDISMMRQLGLIPPPATPNNPK
jgi:predicted ester cyclase